jgi:hypothetical protein
MYELMCGRIPYEGPDTKTTNGYVVQGNAPPPTKHDGSIPEPLATVTMTALQPSAQMRFKDASEAEQALREAWDRCLTQGLVHPAVLAMDETPHDKAPARMHEPRGLPKVAGRVPIGVNSEEMTAVTSTPSPGVNPGASTSGPPRPAPPLAIESTRARPGDDDPTKLMVRDEVRAKGDPTALGIGLNKVPAADIRPAPRDAPASAADTKSDPSAIKRIEATAPKSGRGLIIVSVVLLLLSAGAAGLYFSGLLG